MTRREAIEILKQYSLYSPTSQIEEALDMAIKALQDRPNGEWLQREVIDDDMECGVNDDATECSVCGYVFNSHYWAKTYFNFCPSCGAIMKGGAE